MTKSISICVVGGSGMLGSYLIPYLRGLGHRVFCFSRKSRVGDDNVLGGPSGATEEILRLLKCIIVMEQAPSFFWRRVWERSTRIDVYAVGAETGAS